MTANSAPPVVIVGAAAPPTLDMSNTSSGGIHLQHKKSNSLVGFDPFLATGDPASSATNNSNTNKGVWTGQEITKTSSYEEPLATTTTTHPLHTPAAPPSTTKPPKMPFHRGPTPPLPAGAELMISNSSMNKSNRHQRSRITTSLGSTELKSASQKALSNVFPGSNNNNNSNDPPPVFVNKRDDDSMEEMDRITLGESRRDSQASRRQHRKSGSLGRIPLVGGMNLANNAAGDAAVLAVTTNANNNKDNVDKPSGSSRPLGLPKNPAKTGASSNPPSAAPSPVRPRNLLARARASSFTLRNRGGAMSPTGGSPPDSPKRSTINGPSSKPTSPLGNNNSSHGPPPRSRASTADGGRMHRRSGSGAKPLKNLFLNGGSSMRLPPRGGDGVTSPPRGVKGASNPTSPVMTPPKLFNTNTIASAPQTPDLFAPVEMPLLAKPSPTSFFTDATTLVMHSSEQDPSKFQVTIPSKNELTMDAKLCQVLEIARRQNFQGWSSLMNMSELAMREYVKTGGKQSLETIGLQQDVVQAVLQCSSDIVTVVSYFSQEVGKDKREVLICESQKRSQYIVVYRGTEEEQKLKALKAGANGSNGSSNNNAVKDLTSNILHPNQPVAVHEQIKDAYFGLESKVATRIDELTDENPFADIVMTGHGFAGGLAQIGALRLASLRPTMRVSCHVFGAPKVGQSSFRSMVNSLPNLRIMRVEQIQDVSMTGGGDLSNLFVHCGHSIMMNQGSGRTSKTTDKAQPPTAMAYRFDKHKPQVAATKRPFARKGAGAIGGGIMSIDSYVRLLQEFPAGGWVRDYVGEDVGRGIRGKDNEKRRMV